MSLYNPLSSSKSLTSLDDKEILKGYLAAYHNKKISDLDVSESFWYGYKNGLVDSGKSKLEQEQKELIKSLKNAGKIDDYLLLLEKIEMFLISPYSVMN